MPKSVDRLHTCGAFMPYCIKNLGNFIENKSIGETGSIQGTLRPGIRSQLLVDVHWVRSSFSVSLVLSVKFGSGIAKLRVWNSG
jgi:hypothetical protein